MKKHYHKITFQSLLVGFLLAFTISCQEKLDLSLDQENIEAISFQGGQIIPGQYIVVLNQDHINLRKTNVPYEAQRVEMRKKINALLNKYRILDEQLKSVYVAAIEGFSVTLTDEQLANLRLDPMVAMIETDKVASIAQGNKPKTGGGTGSSTQEVPYGINRVGGFISYTGSNVVWVLDTGIELTHPDLNVDANRGYSVFKTGRDSNLNDGNGHGTHVAGTIAALNNTIGVVGVAAGAKVIPIKVLDSRGSGSNSGVIEGIDFVAANGMPGDVANMSLGGGISSALDNAVINAASRGIRFVLAAGNSGSNADLSSPARANGVNIFTISAMDNNDVFASFSNFGNPPVDYCAPGVAIKSTWLKGGYNTISGTSMAAPHAAGVLLLGAPKISGYVKNDKDNSPDPIISHR
jgi:subtilisin family serine protease